MSCRSLSDPEQEISRRDASGLNLAVSQTLRPPVSVLISMWLQANNFKEARRAGIFVEMQSERFKAPFRSDIFRICRPDG
jgi:hypothetical protein